MKRKYLYCAIGFWSLTALWCSALAPLLLKMPVDYADTTTYATEGVFRNTVDGEWESIKLIGRRIDQALVSSPRHVVVQGDMHWTNELGATAFESTGIFGISRDSRQNLPGYGDVTRNGQFLFPMHTERKSYSLWDAMYLGSRAAEYESTATVNGLEAYVFRFTASGLDETKGYSQLPGVPGNYHVHTNVQGRLWVEPTSGIVVDYEEKGVSYFVHPRSGKYVADIWRWQDRYTDDTKLAKLEQAWQAKRQIQMVEIWIPLAFSMTGLFILATGLIFNRSNRLLKPCLASNNHPSKLETQCT